MSETPEDVSRPTERTASARDDEPAGSRGVAIAVGAGSVGFSLVLPVLIVVGVYSFLTIYAIVKAVGSAPDAANPIVVLTGVIGLVTLFVLLFAAAVTLIGRAGNPNKRP
jgi:hypothetical protein